jgi:hypothetical protein
VDALCELVRLGDLSRLYELKARLQQRAVPAEVQTDWIFGVRGYRRSTRSLRLMVRSRDLVYARWILSEAGLDVWPTDDDDDGDEASVAAPRTVRRRN